MNSDIHWIKWHLNWNYLRKYLTQLLMQLNINSGSKIFCLANIRSNLWSHNFMIFSDVHPRDKCSVNPFHEWNGASNLMKGKLLNFCDGNILCSIFNGLWIFCSETVTCFVIRIGSYFFVYFVCFYIFRPRNGCRNWFEEVFVCK